MCIWGARQQMVRVWERGGAVLRKTVVVMTMEAAIIMAATTTMVTTTIIVAGGDVEGEVSGGEIEEASGVAEAAGEAGEIGVSEETEEAEEAEEIWVSEEADEERAAEEAEGHGVVKETLTKRQTHIARRVGAKRAITLQIKPDGDKAQRRISRQTQMHRRPGEGQAPMPWE
ncbi:hypothetical protein VC83_08236 [Pseudogymnoascus destructans]|uniref:Uncharacterized protein n=1 Tax=Pseudogymnoascus destructans TaxID=655981 RepID=A0A177A2I3_9PEZI|nr:uncharacterized protein VC83_08236 [Pseudogymnoascus destructans]OAF55293.1 hypothetical protein VC83_08236 [Pseudogymnoascus destructans]